MPAETNQMRLTQNLFDTYCLLCIVQIHYSGLY